MPRPAAFGRHGAAVSGAGSACSSFRGRGLQRQAGELGYGVRGAERLPNDAGGATHGKSDIYKCISTFDKFTVYIEQFTTSPQRMITGCSL